MRLDQQAPKYLLPSFLSHDNIYNLAIILVFITAMLIGVTGIKSTPLDQHEVYVAETVAEMSERHNWIVPNFNHELRLNKPPLSYWATTIVAWLVGDLNSVEGWHARIPSLVAGLGLVLLVYFIGSRLFSARVGIIAATLFVTSAGFFSHAHDARTDMLYAFWIVAGFAVFISITARYRTNKPIRFWQVAPMWLCFGVATLSKGPHIPLLFLLAQFVYLGVLGLSLKSAFHLMKPISGLIIWTGTALPWWLLVGQSIGFDAMQEHQISGNLIAPGLTNLFSPYYLIHTPILMLPWIPLAVLAGINFLSRRAEAANTMAIALPLLIVLVGLNLGPQARQVYVLPILPLVWLLVAVGVTPNVSIRDRPELNATTLLFLLLQAVVFIAIAVWYFFNIADRSLVTVLSISAAIGLTVSLSLLTCLKRTLGYAGATLSAAFVLATILWVALAGTRILSGAERYDNAFLAKQARAVASETTPFAAFDVPENVFVYYSKRRIAVLNEYAAIKSELNDSPDKSLGLFTLGSMLPTLRQDFETQLVGEIQDGNRARVFVMLQEKTNE